MSKNEKTKTVLPEVQERAIAEKADYLHYDADGPKIDEAARYDW